MLHFVNNNFEEFIKRYNKRIYNYRNYLNNNNILFVISKNINSIKLKNILRTIYPTLNFDILIFTPPETNDFILNHHYLMKYTEDKYLEETKIFNSDEPYP